MELKKDSNTNNEPKDMDFDGMFDVPVDDSLSQTISENKKHLTNDYARSGTNTSYVGGKAAEWDEKIEKNAFRMSEDQMKKSLEKTAQEKSDDKAKILLASEILMYLAFGFFVLMVVKTSRIEAYDIPHNLKYVSLGVMVLTIVLLIDALLVFFLEARKAMLFVLAMVLGVFYPLYRSKTVRGTVIPGILCFLLAAATWTMLIVSAGQGVTKYGEALVYTEDEYTRHAVAELMDQNAENGTPLRIIIKKAEKNGIQKYEVSDNGDKREITVTGIGSKEYNFGNETLSNPNGMNAVLVFQRKSQTEPFVIKEVTLDSTKLSEKRVKQFWAAMLGD